MLPVGSTSATRRRSFSLRRRQKPIASRRRCWRTKSIILRRLNSNDFPKLEGTDAERFKAEGYVIDVAKSRITVSGASDAGLFYGVQTLRQMITPLGASNNCVLSVHIEDWPTMEW